MMRKIFNYSLLGFGILLFFACNNSTEKKCEIPVIDVAKSYPEKEIILQDIADVEYIPLETRDDVLLDGHSEITSISNDKFLVVNAMKGDVFLFSIDGKFISHFNHKGQGGTEYNFIAEVIANTKTGELFLFDSGSQNRIQVYGMNGDYKRTVRYNKDLNLSSIKAFGTNRCVAYQSNFLFFEPKDDAEKDKKPELVVLSRDNGEIDTIITLPTVKGVDAVSWFEKNGRKGFFIRKPSQFVESKQGLIVNEIACDTVFVLKEDKSLSPVFIRTPGVSPSDNPLKMFAVEKIINDYYFLSVMLKEFEIGGKDNFPVIDYFWDKRENTFYEYSLKNKDVEVADKVATLDKLFLVSVDDLKDLLEEEKLSGKLKEIAEKLSPDDNPVLVKVRFKE